MVRAVLCCYSNCTSISSSPSPIHSWGNTHRLTSTTRTTAQMLICSRCTVWEREKHLPPWLFGSNPPPSTPSWLKQDNNHPSMKSTYGGETGAFYEMPTCGPEETPPNSVSVHTKTVSLCGFSSGIWPYHLPDPGRVLGEAAAARRLLLILPQVRHTQQRLPFHLNRCAFISEAFREKRGGDVGRRNRKRRAVLHCVARFPWGLLLEWHKRWAFQISYL